MINFIVIVVYLVFSSGNLRHAWGVLLLFLWRLWVSNKSTKTGQAEELNFFSASSVHLCICVNDFSFLRLRLNPFFQVWFQKCTILVEFCLFFQPLWTYDVSAFSQVNYRITALFELKDFIVKCISDWSMKTEMCIRNHKIINNTPSYLCNGHHFTGKKSNRNKNSWYLLSSSVHCITNIVNIFTLAISVAQSVCEHHHTLTRIRQDIHSLIFTHFLALRKEMH